MRLKRLRLNLKQSIALGFLAIIFLGAFLLKLPMACKNGQSLSFIDALFTATSATCVTGLAVFDTYSHFTIFGQMIILVLIQIGGLGFMSVSLLFLIIMGKKINLTGRSLLMESINKPHIGGAVRLVKRILLITFTLELLGAILLSIRFFPKMGLAKSAYYGVFHSVSAFCNAGFDLMGCFKPFTSLAAYRSDNSVNFIIMALIILGGIGFIVWDDIIENGFHIKRYKLHTKIVLSVSGVLIVVSTLFFYFVEGKRGFAGLSDGERFLASLFQAVTPRTAGFSTVGTETLSEAGIVFTMILMFIGASPGSTGGGIKTSTFLVLLLSIIAHVRNRNDLNILGRRLEDGLARRAFNIVTVYFLTAVLGILLILMNQSLPIDKVVFEVFSAIGTVGLSLGITQELSPFSRAIIVLLMYAGRVGSLSLVMALSERKQEAPLRRIPENISIG